METVGIILLAILGLAVLSPLIAYWLGILRVVTVREASSVSFKFTGQFVYMAMQFSGHHFDANGNVCVGPGSNEYGPGCNFLRRLGGWVFYIHPFVAPTDYKEYNDPDGFGDGIFVNLNDITPNLELSGAETAPPDNIPLDVKFAQTRRITNPYKWQFVAPRNANAQADTRSLSVLRGWIRSGDDEHVQQAKGNGAQLWSELVALGCDTVFNNLKNSWGMEVVQDSIIVGDVGYDPAYQAALKATAQAGLLALAAKETAKQKAEEANSLTVLIDGWITAEVKRVGKNPATPADVAEVVKELRASGEYERQVVRFETQLLANSGALKLNREQIEYSGLPDGVQVVGSGGGAFVGVGGKKNRRNDGEKKGGRGKKSKAEEAEDYYDEHGLYPPWYNPKEESE